MWPLPVLPVGLCLSLPRSSLPGNYRANGVGSTFISVRPRGNFPDLRCADSRVAPRSRRLEHVGARDKLSIVVLDLRRNIGKTRSTLRGIRTGLLAVADETPGAVPPARRTSLPSSQSRLECAPDGVGGPIPHLGHPPQVHWGIYGIMWGVSALANPTVLA